MKDKVNIGVIGTGRMGSVHTRNLVRRIPQANVVAVCDIRLDVAQAVVDELGIQRVVRDYRELLADDRIEAVVIASSTNTHAFMMQDAAKAGKHIFCEKPLALDLTSIDEALAAVKKAGVKLQVGFQRRFDTNFRRAHELVVSDKIGTPYILRITSRDPEPPPMEYVQVSGGLFLDMMIHDFDMARFQMGDIEEVYAAGNVLVAPEIGQAGDVDTAIVTLRFKSGAMGVIDNCRKATYGYDQRLEVLGSNGAALVGNEMADTLVQADHDGFHSATLPHFFMQRYAEAYVSEMREFIECVTGDKTPLVTGRDGRLAVVLGYAARKSLQENRPVRLSEIAAV
jgi:myo-inositol 2-dehydrogenase/D-chiro-inositol 1-dehydrogenase